MHRLHRLHEQMHMVSHQDVSSDSTLVRACDLSLGGDRGVVIVLREAEYVAIVATLDVRMRRDRDSKTGSTDHRRLLTCIRVSQG
jgi:hypothetical protein